MNFSAIITRQREYFRSGVTRSLAFRHEQLQKLAALLDTHEAELLDALYADLRKSPHEAYATEIAVVMGEIRHALRHLRSWMKPGRRRPPRMAWPARCHIRREPYGVALIIGPWNYPLQLLLSPLVGAIAAGNCAVLKPSEFAPHTAMVIGRMIGAAFPGSYLAVICGDRETSASLLEEKFDTIFFTGGTGTGRVVMTAAARNLTPVTLELGGKCPCIVLHDAPVETTARRIAWGKFLNAGQTCVAPDHVWVDSRIAGELTAAIKEALRGFYGDNPQQSPDFGRIINRRHFDRLAEYLNDGHIACGGQSDPEDLYISPTVLVDIREDAPVMSGEIFGPILPVLEFSDIGEVLAKLGDQPKPLAVYLFTRDARTAEHLISKTHSGGVCVNDTIMQILGSDLPFGGVGESGMGTYHGRASFDCFSHPRAIMHRSLMRVPDFRYPPPNVPLKWLKRAFRFLS